MYAVTYRFIDLGNISCREIAHAHFHLLLGSLAVNTSWDSGRLSRNDWQSVNGYACSPPLNAEMIENWPISHDDYCDEWWIFRSPIQPDFQVTAFCNYNKSINQYKELDFEGGCNLDLYLHRFQPVAVFGSNDAGYLVRRT